MTRAAGGVHGRLLDDIAPLLDTLLRLASEAGEESFKPVAECGAEDPSQVWSEGTLNPALDHMHAPEQQCDRSGKAYQKSG